MAVKNPMSLVVTSDVTIGATLETPLPIDDAFLINTTYEYPYTQEVNVAIPITIPNAVNCIKVRFYENIDSTLTLQKPFTAYIKNSNSNIIYVSHSLKGGNADASSFIGVTPSKTYNLILYAAKANNFISVKVQYLIQISYSQSINTKVPDITDY